MPQPDIDRRRNDARDDRGGADQRRHAPPVPAMPAEQHRRADRDRGEERQRRLYQDQHREEGRAAVQVDMAEKKRRARRCRRRRPARRRRGQASRSRRTGRPCSRKWPRPSQEKPRARPARSRHDANSRSGCQSGLSHQPSVEQHRTARRRQKKQRRQLGADRQRDRGAEQQPARGGATLEPQHEREKCAGKGRGKRRVGRREAGMRQEHAAGCRARSPRERPRPDRHSVWSRSRPERGRES